MLQTATMTAAAAWRRRTWGRGRCCCSRPENWRYNPLLIPSCDPCIDTALSGRSRKDGCQLLVYLFTLGIPYLFTFHTMRWYEALIHLTVSAPCSLIYSQISCLCISAAGEKNLGFSTCLELHFLPIYLAVIFCRRKNYRLIICMRLHNKYIYVHNLYHKYNI